jgi:hypothetical protein
VPPVYLGYARLDKKEGLGLVNMDEYRVLDMRGMIVSILQVERDM